MRGAVVAERAQHLGDVGIAVRRGRPRAAGEDDVLEREPLLLLRKVGVGLARDLGLLAVRDALELGRWPAEPAGPVQDVTVAGFFVWEDSLAPVAVELWLVDAGEVLLDVSDPRQDFDEAKAVSARVCFPERTQEDPRLGRFT